MSEWKEVCIGDHIDLISGYAFKSLDFLSNQVAGTLPVIKIKNVANGDVNLNDVVFHKYNANLEKFLLSKGDVLIAMTGNHPHAKTQVVGDVSRYKLEINTLLNQRVGKLIVKDDTNLDFIYYLFKSEDVRNYLANQASGSANQANISKGDILGLNLNIPSPTEQTAIASVLSSLDDKIDLLQRQNVTLEKMAETLFRQWFVEEAKEEWEAGNVLDLFKLQRGYDLPSQNREDGTVPIITSSGPNGFHKESRVKGPGVTTGRSGVIGKVFFVEEDFWPLNTSLFVLEFKRATPLYTYFFLKTLDLASLNGGSAVPTLNRNDVHALETELPPIDLIKSFEEKVQPYFKKIKSNQTQIRTLSTLRDTLLPKLMSGEVRVEIN